MPKTSAFAGDLLALIFNNTAIANIGDGPGLQPSATPGSLYVSLHLSDPGVGGDQTTGEISYTGYAREAVARSGAGWTVTGTTADNTAAITFGQCTGGTDTANYFGIGTDLSGVGNLLYSGTLNSGLAISNGVQPEFAIGDCNITEA